MWFGKLAYFHEKKSFLHSAPRGSEISDMRKSSYLFNSESRVINYIIYIIFIFLAPKKSFLSAQESPDIITKIPITLNLFISQPSEPI